MADQSFETDVYRDLLDEAGAVGQLAANEKLFLAAFAAFRAQNHEAFQAALAQAKLPERCRLVCEWIRIKECVFLCLELCGPPKPVDKPPDPRLVVEAIVRVTSNPKLVQQLVQIVEKRDAKAFARFVEAEKLGAFCHFFCHWVCVVRYRLLCEWLCRPIVATPAGVPSQPPSPADIAAELVAAGQTLRALLDNQKAFAAAAAASQAGDAVKLGAAIEQAGLRDGCRWVCEWFCSWRCLWACLTLCRQFPVTPITNEPAEAFAFAQAVAALGKQPAQLQKLSTAIGAGDAKTYTAIVTELKLQAYCIQLCHWLCFLRCRRFCFLVCPPHSIAVFTKIGGLYYGTDVHSLAPGSGLTVGDNRAFYNSLRLNGGLSLVDGAPLIEYRFETVNVSDDGTTLAGGGPILPTSWVPVTGTQIQATNIGSFIRWVGFILEIIPVNVNGPGAGVFNITPSADGWIQVPPMHPVPPMVPGGPPWTFVPGSDLIRFDSTTLAHIASIDETGVVAGATANAPLQTDVHYGVRMRLRNQGTSGDGADAGTCHHIAINNTHYDNISHHPYWPGGLFGYTDELALASIGIAELAAAPCSELTRSLTVEFTAAHSNLGAVSAWLEGPGGPYPFDLNPPTAENPGENWFGTATPTAAWTFAKLPPCAYLLKLSVDPLLTTGDSVPLPLVDYIAFCKGKS